MDDTGARHRAANAVCTQICNDDFAWFGTTGSKSRLNFLTLLHAGYMDYAINTPGLDYKAELLMVLDHPQILLHTNGSENGIRCQVTKRAVSGGTRGDIGRDCRNAFLGLGKTCRKLGVASGITSAPGWEWQAPQRSRRGQTSSAAAASPPDSTLPGILPLLPL